MATPKHDDQYATRPSLLQRIKEGDNVSWNDFYNTYRWFIWSIAKNYHVREADRDEVVNSILLEFQHMGDRFQYDPTQGRFRDYLRRVTQHYILRARKKELGMDNIEEVPEPWVDDFSRVWDDEWKRHVLEQAKEILRKRMDPVTYQVFVEVAVNGDAPEDVATRHNMTRANVDIIKHRGTKMLSNYCTQLGG